MQGTSQVILRNLDLFEQFDKGLVIGLPDDELLSDIKPLHAFTWDYSKFRPLHKRYGDKVLFDTVLPDSTYDQALIFLPKAKEEFNLMLSMVASKLNPGAEIFLVGGKQEGIASAAKRLLDYGENIYKVDSARHCQLWQTELKLGTYSFNIEDWVGTFDVAAGGFDYKACSIPGVFSFGRLDEGTQLLLDSIDRVPSGRILDFGSGSGVIGSFLKMKNPDCSLEMVDIHALALYCSNKTLEMNGLDAKVYPSDGWSDISKKFHAIYTNPPFHSGVNTHYATTEAFIGKAPDYLVSGGRFWLVANQFLKYAQIIEKALGAGDIFRQTPKFKVYRAFKR